MSQFKEVIKLRVKHFPQVPCKPFIAEVESLQEAKKIMDVLANYDLFQLKHKIKTDFCNTQCLEMFNTESNEWESWEDEETGCPQVRDLEEENENLKKQIEKLKAVLRQCEPKITECYHSDYGWQDDCVLCGDNVHTDTCEYINLIKK